MNDLINTPRFNETEAWEVVTQMAQQSGITEQQLVAEAQVIENAFPAESTQRKIQIMRQLLAPQEGKTPGMGHAISAGVAGVGESMRRGGNPVAATSQALEMGGDPAAKQNEMIAKMIMGDIDKEKQRSYKNTQMLEQRGYDEKIRQQDLTRRQKERDINMGFNERQLTAKTDATRTKSAAVQQRHDENIKQRSDIAAATVRAGTERQLNSTRLKEYETLQTSARKFPTTMRDANRITDLAIEIENGVLGMGPIATSDTMVTIRKVLGDDAVQELESLVIGMPLPTLKAMFGGAFSIQEGEKLSDALARMNMDLPTFINRMKAYKENIQFEKDEYDAQTSWLNNQGSLVGYTSSTSIRGTDSTHGTDSTQDDQALEWADANPNDPRAAQIKQRLGVQ